MLKRSKTDEELALDASGQPVLVVNDDANACELISRIVEAAGFPVQRQTKLRLVLDTLEQLVVGGVIIDTLSCGIEEGLALVETIRASEFGETVAIFVLAPSEENRVQSLQIGVDAYLVRPFHANELIDELRRSLSLSHTERAEYRSAQLMGGAATI